MSRKQNLISTMQSIDFIKLITRLYRKYSKSTSGVKTALQQELLQAFEIKGFHYSSHNESISFKFLQYLQSKTNIKSADDNHYFFDESRKKQYIRKQNSSHLKYFNNQLQINEQQTNEILNKISNKQLFLAGTQNKIYYQNQQITDYSFNQIESKYITKGQLYEKLILQKYIVGLVNTYYGGMIIAGVNPDNRNKIKGIHLNQLNKQEIKEHINEVIYDYKEQIQVRVKFIRVVDSYLSNKNHSSNLLELNYCVQILLIPRSPEKLIYKTICKNNGDKIFTINTYDIKKFKNLQLKWQEFYRVLQEHYYNYRHNSKQIQQKIKLIMKSQQPISDRQINQKYYPSAITSSRQQQSIWTLESSENCAFKKNCYNQFQDGFNDFSDCQYVSYGNEYSSYIPQNYGQNKSKVQAEHLPMPEGCEPKLSYKHKSILSIGSQKSVKTVQKLISRLKKGDYQFEILRPFQQILPKGGRIIYTFSYEAKINVMRQIVKTFKNITIIPLTCNLRIPQKKFKQLGSQLYRELQKWYSQFLPRQYQIKEDKQILLRFQNYNVTVFAYCWLQLYDIRPTFTNQNFT